MKCSKIAKSMHLVVASLFLAIGLLTGGCSHDKLIKRASIAISYEDYERALKLILTLSDKEIAESDTLTQLLSTAYYGMKLKPVRNIAVECYDMDFTPDGKTVVFTDFHNGALNFYDYPEMSFRRSILMPEKAYGIDISPDGSTIAAAMADKSILLYDLQSGRKLKSLEGHTGRVRDVVFSDNNTLFSCSNDHRISAWNVATGERYFTERLSNMNIKNLHLSSDKSRLVTASNGGTACVVSANPDDMGKVLLRVHHGVEYVNDAAVTPDNYKLLTASGDNILKIWDAHTGKLIKDVFLNDPLASISISPDGKYVFAGGKFNAYIVDIKEERVVTKIHGMGKPIWAVKFLGNDEFAFVDDSRFWRAKFLKGTELIKEVRKIGITE